MLKRSIYRMKKKGNSSSKILLQLNYFLVWV
jgi:hypothetical protein